MYEKRGRWGASPRSVQNVEGIVGKNKGNRIMIKNLKFLLLIAVLWPTLAAASGFNEYCQLFSPEAKTAMFPDEFPYSRYGLRSREKRNLELELGYTGPECVKDISRAEKAEDLQKFRELIKEFSDDIKTAGSSCEFGKVFEKVPTFKIPTLEELKKEWNRLDHIWHTLFDLKENVTFESMAERRELMNLNLKIRDLELEKFLTELGTPVAQTKKREVQRRSRDSLD